MAQVNGRQPTWMDKNRIGALMRRVEKHANAEIEMTSTQLAAAKLYLSKTLPDLARTENKHDGELGIKVSINYPGGNKPTV